MKSITKTVWILSFISLFTDTASEMLYPVMPVFLKSIGFSVVLIGILEGIAEAWISNITDKKDTATAIGSFAGFQSIAAMIASSFAGLLWFWFGVETAFIATSVVTVGVIIYFLTFVKQKAV